MGERPLVASVHALYEFTLSEILPFSNVRWRLFSDNTQFQAILQLSSGDVAVGRGGYGCVLLNRSGGFGKGSSLKKMVW